MAQTLKQRHIQLRATELRERLVKHDNQLLREMKISHALVEALDANDLKRASAIIEKLQGLKGKGLQSLDVAIEQAINDLNKFTGGGPIDSVINKVKDLVGYDNPLVKITTFANALEMGFKQVPTILKNNLGKITPDNENKTLGELAQDPDKQKTIADNLMKALSPGGVFGAFKKVPYVDKKTLIADLMATKLGTLNSIIQQTTSGPQTQDIAADIKDMVGNQPGSPSGQQKQQNQQPQQAQATPSGQSAPTPQGQQGSNVSDDKLKSLAKDIAGKYNLDYGEAERTLRVLRKIGKLKEALQLNVVPSMIRSIRDSSEKN